MKTHIKTITGEDSSKEMKFPEQFEEPVREDLIQRSVLAIQSNKRQPYGADSRAGKKQAALVSKRRRDFKGVYGKGQSRGPRKTMSRRGSQFHFVGAFAPNTVGGRKAHPPKAEKVWSQKINKKENRKAIRSALAASINKELVKKRGHLFTHYPLIIEDKAENLTKTKEVKEMLEKLGLSDELKRSEVKKVRAGKGTMRGRKYQKKKGILIIVSKKDSSMIKAARTIPGVDIELVEKINAELLAPGTIPGRLTIYTEAAIKRLEKEKLFTEQRETKKITKEQ